MEGKEENVWNRPVPDSNTSFPDVENLSEEEKAQLRNLAAGGGLGKPANDDKPKEDK